MKTLPSEPGVYTITHEPTGRFYIGSTGDLHRRIRVHKYRLKSGSHHNTNLQSVFTTTDDLSITIAVASSIDEALDAEQELLDLLQPNELCCNVATGSRSTWAVGKAPPELIEQNRLRSIGNTFYKLAIRGPDSPYENLGRPAKKIAVNEVVYVGLAQAAKALGISMSTVYKRVVSTDSAFINWYYL